MYFQLLVIFQNTEITENGVHNLTAQFENDEHISAIETQNPKIIKWYHEDGWKPLMFNPQEQEVRKNTSTNKKGSRKEDKAIEICTSGKSCFGWSVSFATLTPLMLLAISYKIYASLDKYDRK